MSATDVFRLDQDPPDEHKDGAKGQLCAPEQEAPLPGPQLRPITPSDYYHAAIAPSRYDKKCSYAANWTFG